MKVKTVLLLLFIVSLVFLVRSPALAGDRALDPARAAPVEIDAKEGPAFSRENYLSDAEYFDPTLHVTVERDRYLDTDMWIARVRIAHPSQIRSALAGRYGSQHGSAAAYIAKRVNGVVAINGDNYGFDNRGVTLRQGHLYRNRPNGKDDVLIIDDKGDFHVVTKADKDSFAEAYGALGGSWEEGGSVVNILYFGPQLVKDGAHAHEVYARYNTGVDVPAQRMAIAQAGPLAYLLVTCEGPESPGSVGLTVRQMADYMVELGCETAYNLDGGSSSTLVFQDRKINSPDTRKVRPVSDIIYFTSALADGR